MNYNYKNLPPFKFYILQNFPYIEEDFDAITNWQLFCKLGEEINKIIVSVNETGGQVENLTQAFNDLTDYVNNYFENLDVQDEIDNKLDEMAEQGELTELITAYLNIKSILAFDTVADMKLAENIIDGSFLRTYGKLTYNDGEGAFYKVRPITSGDVVDEVNIISLSISDTLIAEKMPDATINSILSDISDLDDRVTSIENSALKKWIFVGDSYSQGYTEGGVVTSWSQLLKTKMNLTSDNCTIVDNGGTGFGNNQNSFAMLLNSLTADSDVTDILIAGGYNDLTYSSSNIAQGFSDAKDVIETKFPNAKVHIAFIGGTTNQYHGNVHLKTIEYQKNSLAYDWKFLNNVWYVLYNVNNLATDGVHPNTTGQQEIAKALYQALNGGYTYLLFNDIVIDNSESNGYFSGTTSLHHYSNNNISSLSNYSGVRFLSTNQTTLDLSHNGSVKIGKLQSQAGIIGTNYYTNDLLFVGNCVVQNVSNTLNGYVNVPMHMYINENGEVYLKVIPSANLETTDYLTLDSVRKIQIPLFSVTFPTDVY